MDFASKIVLKIAVILLLCLPIDVYGNQDTVWTEPKDTCAWEKMMHRRAAQMPTEGVSVVLITSAEAICSANPFFSFMPRYTDDGTIGEAPTFIYEYSEDGNVWSSFCRSTNSYTQRPANLREGWYRVSMTRKADIDFPERHIVSDVIYLQEVDGGCTPFAHPWDDEISEYVCPNGTLLFREDFGGNSPSDPVTSKEPLTTMSSKYTQLFDVISSPSSGRFVVAKHGMQNGLNTSKTDNLYSQWFVQDDHTFPNDYTRGYLLLVDGRGGNDAFYSTTFPVCHELDLSFSAYVANILEPGHKFSKPKVRFLIQDVLTGDTIWEQSSGPIAPAPEDYLANGYPTVQSAPWHLVGASFHVPSGVRMIRLSIFNDESSSSGNDFAMDDIEIRLCKQEIAIVSDNEICMDSTYIFEKEIISDGSFQQPYEYLWQYSTDSLSYDSEEWINVKRGENLTFEKIALDNSGWYRLLIASNGVDVETEKHCRAVSAPFHLTVNDCTPPCPELIEETDDITVCDTLLPYRWHDTLFTKEATYEIVYKNQYGCDVKKATYTLHTVPCCPDVISIEKDTTVCDTILPLRWHNIVFDNDTTIHITTKNKYGCTTKTETYTLSTVLCCPDLLIEEIDTIVCDTLMPFVWKGLVFAKPAEQEILKHNVRGCDSILHIYTLDTVHCERLYPIIVNKYNWQLLCDNVALRRLFPDNNAIAFQWYKDDQQVAGATEDDYAEQEELHGVFQLRVGLDNGQTIWSNIISLTDTPSHKPVRKRIYNSSGVEIGEDQITHGVYLFRYEQGDKVWTEKIIRL